MKVIIAGTRTFCNYELLKEQCDAILANTEVTAIVSGGNGKMDANGTPYQGADLLGERYAAERGYPVEQYLPDWSQGRKAGPLRNERMVEAADALIAFYDGVSRGTGHCIKAARRAGLEVRIVRID